MKVKPITVKRVVSTLAILVAATFATIWGYKEFVNWRFGVYAIKYDREIDRRVAYAAFNIAGTHMTSDQLINFDQRLALLENDYRHPTRAAFSAVLDPNFMTTKRDSFDDVLDDLLDTYPRTESPGKEIFELWQAQSEIGIVAWQYVCEDWGVDSRKISYEEYLKLKKRFDPAKEEVETLLSAYEK